MLNQWVHDRASKWLCEEAASYRIPLPGPITGKKFGTKYSMQILDLRLTGQLELQTTPPPPPNSRQWLGPLLFGGGGVVVRQQLYCRWQMPMRNVFGVRHTEGPREFNVTVAFSVPEGFHLDENLSVSGVILQHGCVNVHPYGARIRITDIVMEKIHHEVNVVARSIVPRINAELGGACSAWYSSWLRRTPEILARLRLYGNALELIPYLVNRGDGVNGLLLLGWAAAINYFVLLTATTNTTTITSGEDDKTLYDMLFEDTRRSMAGSGWRRALETAFGALARRGGGRMHVLVSAVPLATLVCTVLACTFVVWIEQRLLCSMLMSGGGSFWF